MARRKSKRLGSVATRRSSGGNRCPKEGTRYSFRPNPAAAMFYDGNDRGYIGASGVATSLPVPGGRRTCMPGPRGGLVYLRFQNGAVFGVFKNDLKRS